MDVIAVEFLGWPQEPFKGRRVFHTGPAVCAPYPNPSSARPMALPKPKSPAVTPGFFFAPNLAKPIGNTLGVCGV